MNVQDIITYIDSLSLGEVIYGTPNDVNIRIDRKKGPFIIIYMVEDADIDLAMDRMIPTYSFKVFVCDRTPLDAKGEVIQATVDLMMVTCIRLLMALRSQYRMDSKFTMHQSWAKYDATVSGVTADFTIKGAPVCLSNFDPTPEPTPEPDQE